MPKKKKKVHKFPVFWILGLFCLMGMVVLSLSWYFFNTPKQDVTQEATLQLHLNITEQTQDSFTVQAVVQNHMSFPVEDVALVFDWPAGILVQEVHPTGYTYKERLRQIEIGTLSAQENKTVEVKGVSTVPLEGVTLPVTLGYQNQEGVKQEKVSLDLPALHPESQLQVSLPALAPIQGHIPFTIRLDPTLMQAGMQIHITKPAFIELVEASVPFNEDTLFVEGEIKDNTITGSFFANTTTSQNIPLTVDVSVVRLGKSIIAKSFTSSVALFNSGLVTQLFLDGKIFTTVGWEVGHTHTISVRVTNNGNKSVKHLSFFIPFVSSVLKFTPDFYDNNKKGFFLDEHIHPELTHLDPGQTMEVSVDVPLVDSFDPVEVFAGGQEQIFLNTIVGYEREKQTWQQQVSPVIIKFSSDLHIIPVNKEPSKQVSLDVYNAINWVDDVKAFVGYSGGELKNTSVWRGKGAQEVKDNTIQWVLGMVSPGKSSTGLRLEFDAPATIEWITWSGKDRHTQEPIAGSWGTPPVTENAQNR